MLKRNEWLLNGTTIPAGWPANWDFPASAWPPGYQKPFPYDFHLIASYSSGTLSVHVHNEYGEDVNDLDGQYIEVRGGVEVDGQWKCIRVHDDNNNRWQKGALLIISGGRVAESLQFDTERLDGGRLKIHVGLYGHIGGEVLL